MYVQLNHFVPLKQIIIQQNECFCLTLIRNELVITQEALVFIFNKDLYNST